MNLQMINVLTLFWAFSSSYINMLVIMLDPHFKNMKVIWDYVGNMVVVNVVSKYDCNLCTHYCCMFTYI